MIKRKIRQPRIALLVDNPERDLPGLILTAWRLAQKGTTCLLVPMNLRWEEIWSLAPDFVLLNHCKIGYEELISQMFSKGIEVGVLPTEGGVLSAIHKGKQKPSMHLNTNPETPQFSYESYVQSVITKNEIRRCLSLYSAWSHGFADYVLKQKFYSSEQLAVTGTPRTDFLATKWQPVLRDFTRYLDSYTEPVILINGGFPLSNPRFNSPDAEAKELYDYFKFDKEYILGFQKIQANALKEFVKLANALATRFPEAMFVFRPHPFERLETYAEVLDDLPNLRLVQKGTVDGWLLRVKAIIHFQSSTAIEASILGIPALHPGWIPKFTSLPPVEAVSVTLPDISSMMYTLKEIFDGVFNVPSKIKTTADKIITSTFNKVDGLSHQRLADEILARQKASSRKVSIAQCQKVWLSRNPKSWTSRLSFRLKKILGLPPHWSLLHFKKVTSEIPWDKSEKYFSLEQVQQIVDSIQKYCPAEYSNPQLVSVESASDRGEYQVPKTNGRTIAITS